MNPDNNYFCGTFPIISSVENVNSTQIEIFPNPASQYVSILMQETDMETKQVYIYNIQGQLQLQTSFEGSSFDMKIEDLISGTYYINIQSSNQSISEKLIVIND